jgi:hypothetical protein
MIASRTGVWLTPIAKANSPIRSRWPGQNRPAIKASRS